MIESPTLVIGKEEKSTLYDGAAKGSTEHVPPQLWRGRHTTSGSGEIAVAPSIRVEFVVAEEFESVPVKAISTRLDRRVYDSALKISEFGGSVLCDEIEFLNCVGRRREAKLIF